MTASSFGPGTLPPVHIVGLSQSPLTSLAQVRSRAEPALELARRPENTTKHGGRGGMRRAAYLPAHVSFSWAEGTNQG